jgi:UDP-N-acetylmuramoyl-L-alanyl-D-glutamate--2,6-diaminopimelate ligase
MTLLHHASPDAALHWLRERGALALATDSRRVRPGDAFIAWPGYAFDARQFVSHALDAGAVACLVEAAGVEAFDFADPRVAAMRGLKALCGVLASRFMGEPSASLQVLAVTGTNGKTSSAWWTAQAMSHLGRRCGVIGTLGIGEPPEVESSGLTTPDPVSLQTALRRFADAGVVACAIEASSIGIVEDRLAGTRVVVAQFTNFTRDHLDYHGTMESYWAAKRRLFAWPGLRAAVVNIDDDAGAALAAELQGVKTALWTCAVERPARLRATAIGYLDGGLAFEVREGERTAAVRTRLIGHYNVANLLVVAGGLRALGEPLDAIASAFGRLTSVPGRMQSVELADPDDTAPASSLPHVVVDYAHTPDALEKALVALRPFARERGGRLWCVFGCGGNRDATKRPLMGAIAERLADEVVLTSDNPRHEAPSFILSQILAGVVGHDEVAVIEDRAAAIEHAVSRAAPADVVLVAGKGHEDYQEIGGMRRPFSDVEQARAALARRTAA